METIFGIPYFIIKFLVAIIIVAFFIRHSISFLKPKLSSQDTLEFLESIECIYIEHKSLKKGEILEKNIEKFSLKNFASTNSEYKLVAFSLRDKTYKLFWVKITRWFYFPFILDLFFNEKIKQTIDLKFFEEKNPEILSDLKLRYDNIVIVDEKCPACGSKLQKSSVSCLECGLYLI